MAELAEKILQNINNVFASDPDINECDILPVIAPESNKNPVLLENHKLGLEAWAAKCVYMHCYQKLMAYRERRRTTNSIKHADCVLLSDWSRVVVLVTSDCTTAWNVRKELVCGGHLGVEEELKLTQLVLTKHPKSSDTFQHRKWALSRMWSEYFGNSASRPGHFATRNPVTIDQPFQENDRSAELSCKSDENVHNTGLPNESCAVSNDSGDEGQSSETSSENLVLVNGIPHNLSVRQGSLVDASTFHCCEALSDAAREKLQQELELCQITAERYANNYHAWTHRIWVIQHGIDRELADSEMTLSDRFLLRHVSDHSAYHHRFYLLQCMAHLQDLNSYRNLLRDELTSCLDTIQTYPGHEAVWYYRRSLLHLLICHMERSPDPDDGSGSLPKRLKGSRKSLIEQVLCQEVALCQGVADQKRGLGGEIEGERQRELCKRHNECVMRMMNARGLNEGD